MFVDRKLSIDYCQLLEMGDELFCCGGSLVHQGHDGQLGGRLGGEQQRPLDPLPVVGRDGGHRPVAAHALVQLGLHTQELLEVVPSQVDVRDVAADEVGPDLLDLVIHSNLRELLIEPEDLQRFAELGYILLLLGSLLGPLLALFASFATPLLLLAAVGLDLVQP